MDKIKINRAYKDRVFCLLFGSEEYKENALSLYNAVSDTDYKNVDEITFCTLEDAVYLKVKNDVAVLLDSRLSLWEHQSSYNPNMPLRGLIYFGEMYDSYAAINDLNIYGSKLVRIPLPRYYVFYNGNSELPAVLKLKLSDAFVEKDDSGEFEWTATMLNLNIGKNDKLLEKCKILNDYMAFVNTVKAYSEKTDDKIHAIDEAVKECVRRGILADFLLKHRSEVISMVLTEFNEEIYRKGIYEEGKEQGIEQGIEALILDNLEEGKTRDEIIKKLVRRFDLSVEDAEKHYDKYTLTVVI